MLSFNRAIFIEYYVWFAFLFVQTVFYTLKQCILCNINNSKEVFATCPSVSMAFCQKFMSVKTVARPFL